MSVFLQQGNQNCIQCFKYDLTNILYSCNIASQCPDQQRHAYQTPSAPCVPTFMELNSVIPQPSGSVAQDPALIVDSPVQPSISI